MMKDEEEKLLRLRQAQLIEQEKLKDKGFIDVKLEEISNTSEMESSELQDQIEIKVPKPNSLARFDSVESEKSAVNNESPYKNYNLSIQFSTANLRNHYTRVTFDFYKKTTTSFQNIFHPASDVRRLGVDITQNQVNQLSIPSEKLSIDFGKLVEDIEITNKKFFLQKKQKPFIPKSRVFVPENNKLYNVIGQKINPVVYAQLKTELGKEVNVMGMVTFY